MPGAEVLAGIDARGWSRGQSDQTIDIPASMRIEAYTVSTGAFFETIASGHGRIRVIGH